MKAEEKLWMRSLKRVLGLVLTSILAVGVMAVSVSASYEYVDGSHNVEAIALFLLRTEACTARPICVMS